MATAKQNPYQILGVEQNSNELGLRVAYRGRVREFKEDRLKPFNQRTKRPEDYQLLCRAYETVADRNKRKLFDETGRWTSSLPIEKYTIQQLAADPYLSRQLTDRLSKATLAEINAQDPETGHTPLYVAARACNVDAVDFLAEQDAEPDLKQKYGGSTALHVAAFYQHPDMVRCLLQNGADFTQKNSYGNTPEAEACDACKKVFAEMKNDPYVQAAANQLDWFTSDPNHLSQHIDYQYHTLGQTLLHCACKKGHSDLVRWLVEEREANLDIIDVNLQTALHLAAHKGHRGIVKYLLERGANTRLMNKWGMTAEQEGLMHGDAITREFDALRARDMHTMAFEGHEWWFRYHFDETRVNESSEKGANVLYLACRNGHLSLARWLIEHNAKVNAQLDDQNRSTPLHGAVYHNHLPVVELLIAHGADVNIRNAHNETSFDNARTNEMKKLLQKYRDNLKEQKLIVIHLYGDGKKSGNLPLAKLNIHWDADLHQLRKVTKEALGDGYDAFTIARRPLHIESDNVKVVSALYRARHCDTKFIDLPICLTVHERTRYMNSGHVMRPDPPAISQREFDGKIRGKSNNATIKLAAGATATQQFTVGELTFLFPAGCVSQDVTITVDFVDAPDHDTFRIQGAVYLFKTNAIGKGAEFCDMPSVRYKKDTGAKLYSWIPTSSYWFGSDTARLPMIDGVHAFVRHQDIFPPPLTLPGDMFVRQAGGKALIKSDRPVQCYRLEVRPHDAAKFPLKAYHGTNINVIASILRDGFVMPSTVVSNGFRVCPPPGHIARGIENFGIKDFSNAIFVSPSIHYSSDPVYAVTFQAGDQLLFPVLECGIKRGTYKTFPSTVTTYKPHPDDDTKQLEWRLENPGDIQIIGVLFIPMIKSRIDAAKWRAGKLGVASDDA